MRIDQPDAYHRSISLLTFAAGYVYEKCSESNAPSKETMKEDVDMGEKVIIFGKAG